MSTTAYKENRRILADVLAYYGAKSVEELNANDDDAFWSEKMWESWKFIFHDNGCYSQAFDMTKPKDGAFPVVEHFAGERRFYRDEADEVAHEKRFFKESGEEHKAYVISKSENLFEDGLAMLPEGPMMATVRLFGYPPYGHGTCAVNQMKWGAPVVSQISLQPNEQIRLSVLPLFMAVPGAKGPLLKTIIFRDESDAKPFSKSAHWAQDGAGAVIRKVDRAEAIKTIFPDAQSAHGFVMRPEMVKGCRLRVTDGVVFDVQALSEGGDDAQFFALNEKNVLLNVVQAPEQGKPHALKWRLLWRVDKRLMVGVIAYNAETLKPEHEAHEYAFE